MSGDPLTTLGTADRDRLEALLVEFDLGWGPDRLAAAVEQLPPAGRLRTAGLREFIRIDMERHARRGHPVALDEYAARYPELLETGVGLSPLLPTGDEPTPHVPASAGPPKLPELFGRYRILRPLGRGGMGSVYLARDTELDRLVALKVPHFRPDELDAAERFAREAKAAATIDHPNVCRVYDVGRIDGIPFLTMAYVDGPTLADEMRSAPLSPRQSAQVVRDVARGMAEAHRLGVIHRDLKPGNILLAGVRSQQSAVSQDRTLTPVVTDFGLARRAADDLRLTSSGTVLGTPLYMAPEQVAGDTARIGPASDVYALGVVLYELLAGRPPFGMDRTQIMAGTLSQDPPAPSSIRRDVDPRLDSIVLKTMAKRPDERSTMARLADALDAWLRDDSPPPIRRRRWLIGVAVAAIVLGLLLPAAVKLGWISGPGASEKKVDNGTKGEPGRVVKTDTTVKQGGEVKAEPKGPAVPRPLGSGTIADAKFQMSGVGFSPDSQKVFIGVTDRTIAYVHCFDALTGKDESVKMDRLLKGWITFSPDGRRFIAGDGGNFTRSSPDGHWRRSEVVRNRAAYGGRGRGANSSRVVIGGETIRGDPFAKVFDTNSGAMTGQFPGHRKKVQVVAISDDATWAYSVSPDREALWDVKSGQALVTSNENTNRCAIFIPKTTWCAVGNVHGHVAVLDATMPNEVLHYADRHQDTVTCLTVSPDGNLLLSGSMDRSIRAWDPARDHLKWKLPDLPAAVRALAVSPDGKRLVAGFANRTWQVWALP